MQDFQKEWNCADYIVSDSNVACCYLKSNFTSVSNCFHYVVSIALSATTHNFKYTECLCILLLTISQS